MFIVDPAPKFTHDVKVKVPVDGGFRDESFKVTFNVVPIEEAASFDLSRGTESTEFLLRAIVTISDLVDVNKQPVPYNDQVRDQLLGLNYVRKALGETYFAAVSGERSKN